MTRRGRRRWRGTGRDSEDAVTARRQPVKAEGKPFTEFDLCDAVQQGIRDAGFLRCTPIQELTLPITLEGRDVAGQAQTGTGKTAAFLITIFERLLRMPKRKAGMPSALILAPTRELTLQIYHDAQILGAHTGLNMMAVFGGIDYQRQAAQLRQGTDIVVATPGRLIDYMKKKAFLPQRIKILVVDEADRMFDMGFIKDLRYILNRLPPYDQRQSLLFSATLSARVIELTYRYMNLPEEIYVTPEEVTVDAVDQSVIHLAKNEKLSLLLGLLSREEWTRVLIFVNTKAGAEWLAAKLKANGHAAQALTGDLNQRRRLRLVNRYRQGDLKILVATDVASRGLHVEDISHVINYDLPQDREDYVHRIGRTARAGKSGKAISLACEEYVYSLSAIEEYIGERIPVIWPSDDWFLPDRAKSISKAPRRARRGREREAAASRKRRGPRKKTGRPAGASASQTSKPAGKAQKRSSRRGKRSRSRRGPAGQGQQQARQRD
ncbi:MAG: DEAD/DEAH box helicase [Deltaproteobacteria bacterium]|nr:DEAD/DEAH box helicase [Deltaproteobacteria bacterium]